MLERRDRRGDIVAAVLLTVGISCSSVGVIVLIGAIVEMLLVTVPANWRRLWVVAVPAVLYALWYTQYGVNQVKLSYAHYIPYDAYRSLAAALGSITGLTTLSPTSGVYGVATDPGTALAALALVALAIRFLRGGRLSFRFWGLMSMLVAWWVLDTLSYVEGRDPTSSKYMYPVAIFVLLVAAECCAGWRMKTRGYIVLGIAALVAIVSNLGFLHEGAKEFDRDSVYARAELTAMQVARGIISPTFSPGTPAITAVIGNPNVIQVVAGPYFSAIDAFGSQADSVPTLLRQPNGVRQAADVVLVKAERLTLRRASLPSHGCTSQRPAAGMIQLTTGPGTIVLQPAAPGIPRVLLRRFASTYLADVGATAPDRVVALSLPADRSSLPWHLGIVTSAPVTICRST
jgi:hypothetical protein